MRRIDLFCKLLAPVFISLIDSISTQYAIWTVFTLNTASVLVEYMAIAQVYQSVPALKKTQSPTTQADDTNSETTSEPHQNTSRKILNSLPETLAPWKEYIASPVFLASFALSLLYLTVLSFGATMTTYLLDTGFTSLQVSYMRIGAVAAEISGTWTAPMIMNRIGPIRSGLWFLNWQFACVAGAAVAFVAWDSSSRFVAGTLIAGVALSRVGLWGFDLSVQFLVQEVSCFSNIHLLDYALRVLNEWHYVEYPGTCPCPLLCDGNGAAECFRDAFFCFDDCFPAAGSVRVSRDDQFWGCGGRCCLFCGVCAQGTGSSTASITVYGWG